MKQAILAFLEKNNEIEKIRRKYDPFYKKYKTHLTLTYSFGGIPRKEIYEGIKKAIKGIKPFNLVFRGLKKSKKEYYLYLLANEGKDKIIKLKKNLGSKFLVKHRAINAPPHITLGIFKTKKQIDDALRNLKKENLIFNTKIKEIYLLNLTKNKNLISFRRFALK